MAISSIKLEQIVLEASLNGDIAPVLATGGASITPALSIANQVLVAMLNGGGVAQPMPWKWNRFYTTPFATISYQQDYATNNLTIGWLENCQAIDVNNTAVPKPVVDVTAVKDLVVTYKVTGYPGRICWAYNNQLMYGTWGATAITNEFGLSNPGANVKYTNPVGASVSPTNPITQIQDPNGNYWVLTTYGTCGSSQPSWPASPTFPTVSNPSATATTQADGTCVWTAINPLAQGFRIAPIPPQNGRVWQIRPIAQSKPVNYSSLENLLTPVPDEMYTYFLNGFTTYCYQKSPDPKIRLKFDEYFKLWLQSLDNCIRAGNREPDDFRFVPEQSIMSPSYGNTIRPDYPFGPMSQF